MCLTALLATFGLSSEDKRCGPDRLSAPTLKRSRLVGDAVERAGGSMPVGARVSPLRPRLATKPLPPRRSARLPHRATQCPIESLTESRPDRSRTGCTGHRAADHVALTHHDTAHIDKQDVRAHRPRRSGRFGVADLRARIDGYAKSWRVAASVGSGASW